MQCSIVKSIQFADGCRGELLYIILGRCFDQSYVLDIIWCFCNDSALYQMHLYELGKKFLQQKLRSSVQIA